MSQLKLETHDNRTQFAPGQMIEGLAGWQVEEPPERVTLYLFWHTTGKGDRDVGVIDKLEYENAVAVDAQIFSFKAPDGPYSYDGKLIAIHWALELVVEPGHRVERLDLIISPTGAPITPPADAEPAEASAGFKFSFQ
ncbi:MAG: hypothetical protein ACODAQ_08005 [Phycisphaeraceae bacterium]